MARTVSSDPSMDGVLASEFMAGAPIDEDAWQRYARSANLALMSDGAGCHAQVVWPEHVGHALGIIGPLTQCTVPVRLPLPSRSPGPLTTLEFHFWGAADVAGAVIALHGGATSGLLLSVTPTTTEGVFPVVPASFSLPAGEIQSVNGEYFVDIDVRLSGTFTSIKGVYLSALEASRVPSDVWALAEAPPGAATWALGPGDVYPADTDALSSPGPLTAHELRSALARARHHERVLRVKLFFSSLMAPPEDIISGRCLPPSGAVSVARVASPGDTWRLSAYVVEAPTIDDARILVGHVERDGEGKPVFREWARFPIAQGVAIGWNSWTFRVPSRAHLFGPDASPDDGVQLAVYATGAMPSDVIQIAQPTLAGSHAGTARGDGRGEGYSSGDFPGVIAVTIWGP